MTFLVILMPSETILIGFGFNFTIDRIPLIWIFNEIGEI